MPERKIQIVVIVNEDERAEIRAAVARLNLPGGEHVSVSAWGREALLAAARKGDQGQ